MSILHVPDGARTCPASQRTGVAACRVALLAALLLGAPTSGHADIQCDVAIIGGGPSGVHTAYKLITKHLTTEQVCLFEAGDHLGGRVGNNYNIGLNSAQTGTGGYRMPFNQYTYKLGLELRALGQAMNPPRYSSISSRRCRSAV